jgi:hypothetical protein
MNEDILSNLLEGTHQIKKDFTYILFLGLKIADNYISFVNFDFNEVSEKYEFFTNIFKEVKTRFILDLENSDDPFNVNILDSFEFNLRCLVNNYDNVSRITIIDIIQIIRVMSFIIRFRFIENKNNNQIKLLQEEIERLKLEIQKNNVVVFKNKK